MLALDKKIIILAVIITMIFSSYMFINNSNNINNSYYISNVSYQHNINGNYYLTGINLKNHYIVMNTTTVQLGINSSSYTLYSNNYTFSYKYTGLAPDVVITNGALVLRYSLSFPTTTNLPIYITNTFVVFNNSIPFTYKAYNFSLSDLYYQPTIISFNYNLSSQYPTVFSQDINYYNNVLLKPLGSIEFQSSNLFNLTVNNIKYININNYNLTLPFGSYNYSAIYNNTIINGTFVINNNIKQTIYINFQHFVISTNYIFIVFIITTAVIALLLAYYLNRNFYAFFTLELFFLFIGYQANIPFITISIFAFILFFMVLLLVYKLVLE